MNLFVATLARCAVGVVALVGVVYAFGYLAGWSVRQTRKGLLTSIGVGVVGTLAALGIVAAKAFSASLVGVVAGALLFLIVLALMLARHQRRRVAERLSAEMAPLVAKWKQEHEEQLARLRTDNPSYQHIEEQLSILHKGKKGPDSSES